MVCVPPNDIWGSWIIAEIRGCSYLKTTHTWSKASFSPAPEIEVSSDIHHCFQWHDWGLASTPVKFGVRRSIAQITRAVCPKGGEGSAGPVLHSSGTVKEEHQEFDIASSLPISLVTLSWFLASLYIFNHVRRVWTYFGWHQIPVSITAAVCTCTPRRLILG